MVANLRKCWQTLFCFVWRLDDSWVWKLDLHCLGGSLTRLHLLHLLSHSHRVGSVSPLPDCRWRTIPICVHDCCSSRLCPLSSAEDLNVGGSINGSLWLWIRAVQLNLIFLVYLLISFQFVSFKDCASPLLLIGWIIKLKIHKITAGGRLRTSKGR